MTAFRLDGLDLQMEPSITKWSFEDLGDEPDEHRWRAWWVTESLRAGLTTTGIELRAYPVIKTNPESVWINEDGYREHGRDGLQWEPFNPDWMKKRLLHNGSGSAWAKPTQEEAIHSLAMRLTRWAKYIARDVDKARSAADALEKLKPEYAWAAEHARTVLAARETQEDDR